MTIIEAAHILSKATEMTEEVEQAKKIVNNYMLQKAILETMDKREGARGML